MPKNGKGKKKDRFDSEFVAEPVLAKESRNDRSPEEIVLEVEDRSKDGLVRGSLPKYEFDIRQVFTEILDTLKEVLENGKHADNCGNMTDEDEPKPCTCHRERVANTLKLVKFMENTADDVFTEEDAEKVTDLLIEFEPFLENPDDKTSDRSGV